jgi:T5SS/PEP-CTERM-associated repeat protein/autotransporter-associated beta strand protein
MAMKVFSLHLAALLSFLPAGSFALDYAWNHESGGDFSTSAYWKPAGPPGANDRAMINIPLTGTISLANDVTNGQLLIDLAVTTQPTDVNLDLGNRTYTLHHVWTPGVDDPAVVIGDSSAHTRLAVVHGLVDAYDCTIARLASSAAELCVRGDNNPLTEDRWTAFQHGMTVGDSGAGSLWIDNGATVEHGHGAAGASIGGSGNITVRDPDSLWYCTGRFRLGYRGDGVLEVSQGATARIGRCLLGALRDDPANIFGSGSATIDGQNSTWELLSDPEVSLVIGMEGDGYVTVQNQGHLHNFGHVTIAETKRSYGELIVQSGGTAEIEKSLSLGRGDYVNDDVKALVHVEGADSQLIVKGRGAGDPNTPDPGGDYVGLLVGKTTSGTVEVMHGGYLSNEYLTLVGGDGTGVGVIEVNGMDAHLHNRFRLEIGHLGFAQMFVANGGLVSVTTENSDPNLAEGTKGIVEIGQNAVGFVAVRGHDSNGVPSALVADAQIRIGIENLGILEIEGGARVESHLHLSPSNSAAILGAYDSGPGKRGAGEVTVKDAGSIWTHDGTMNVGFYGQGTLNIEDGGRVASGYGIVARYPGSTGSVSISGDDSVWAIGETLIIGGDAMTKGGTGEVTVSDFGRIELPIAVKIWEGSSLTLDPTAAISADFIEMAGGTIAGSGTIEPYLKITSLARLLTPDASDELVFNGRLTDIGELVKEGPGTVTVNGDADYQGLTTINEGTLLFNGATADLHEIVGSGALGVGADGSPTVLTATSIRVDSLAIGLPALPITVPEPGMLALIISVLPIAFGLCRKRQRAAPRLRPFVL